MTLAKSLKSTRWFADARLVNIGVRETTPSDEAKIAEQAGRTSGSSSPKTQAAPAGDAFTQGHCGRRDGLKGFKWMGMAAGRI